MLKCDGYKMFIGSALITPVNGRAPFRLHGTWLYRPDVDCWYVQKQGEFAQSMPCDVVSDFQEDN